MPKLISTLLALCSAACVFSSSLSALQPTSEKYTATLAPLNEQIVKQVGLLEMLMQEFFFSPESRKSSSSSEIDKLFKSLRQDLQQTPPKSVKEFRHRLRKLFNSIADWHTGLFFHSTEAAVLPFTIREAKGKYFVFTSDPYLHQALGVKPLYVGYEITHWNDEPIKKVVEEFCKEEFPVHRSPYAWRHAAYYLTTRMGAYGQSMPSENEVKIGFIPTGHKKIEYASFPWLHLEEGIKARDLDQRQEGTSELHLALLEKSNMHSPFHDMTLQNEGILKCILQKIKHRLPKLDTHNGIEESEDVLEDWHEHAGRHPLPPIGHVLWEAEPQHLFFSRITEQQSGKKVAYIRLPSFSHMDPSQHEKYAHKFAELMNLFDENSDTLIIDQRMNGGGSLLYMYALLRPLLLKPAAAPKFIERLSHNEIANALDLIELLQAEKDRDATAFVEEQEIETIDGYPFDLRLVTQASSYYQYLLESWNKGKILTDAHHYLGIDTIEPHPTSCYTKPIIVLVDESSLSCGDIFPAMLQDCSRAKIVGTPTAGAGGHIVSTHFPNPFGIANFSYAASLVLRPNGKMIDGKGVKPDVPYSQTTRDLIENNYDYCEFLKKMIK